MLFILFEFQQTRWASRSKPRLRSQDVRSLALYRKRIPKRKFTSLYAIKNCQVLVNWSFEFRLSLSEKTVYVAVAVLYETVYLWLQLGTSCGVACVAAVSFPFVNARGKLRKSGKISSRHTPSPFLLTPSLRLPNFLAYPRRAPSLARFSFACSIFAPPEKGKESAATQATCGESRTALVPTVARAHYILSARSLYLVPTWKNTFTGHPRIMTPIHMTVCSSS